jgi:alkylhydroperoxidase/carboxymuconolactone decarboxylase family protein YurZ
MRKVPGHFKRFIENNPEVGEAYQALGAACKASGPLDGKTAELVKLGISIGAGLEGATHAHTRRSLDTGATHDEIRHAVMLATTTVGFPRMMAGLTWVEDVLRKEETDAGAPEVHQT